MSPCTSFRDTGISLCPPKGVRQPKLEERSIGDAFLSSYKVLCVSIERFCIGIDRPVEKRLSIPVSLSPSIANIMH